MFNISSVLRLESRTTQKNYDAKSVSFSCSVDQMSFLMGQKEILLVHVNCDDETQSRSMVVSGWKMFRLLVQRKIRGTDKFYVTFKYE